MTRASFVLIALLTATSLAAGTLVEDVIRLSKAGVGDDAVVAFIARQESAPITPDELIALTQAGVSKVVVDALVAKPDTDEAAPAEEGRPADVEPAGDETALTEIDMAVIGEPCSVFDPPVEVTGQEPFVPAWLWDPHWYLPTLDTRGGEPPRVITEEIGRTAGVARPRVPDVGETVRRDPPPQTGTEVASPRERSAERSGERQRPSREDRGREGTGRESSGRSFGGTSSRHR